MSFLKKKYNGFSKRLKCASFGIYYGKSSYFKIPTRLKINGRYHDFKFNNIQTRPVNYEFTEICLNDCYHLKSIKKHVKRLETIVDIGSNQGLFIISARQIFPHATIYGYEPNLALEPVLSPNAQKLNAQIYYEAVTKDDCKVSLEFGETDMQTRTNFSANGEITGTSFKKVIERAGGKIGLLKLDCEGAEWDLFNDKETWENVRALTMEYHLWAKEGSTHNDVKKIIENLDFTITFHDPLTDSFGIVTAIKKEGTGIK